MSLEKDESLIIKENKDSMPWIKIKRKPKSRKIVLILCDGKKEDTYPRYYIGYWAAGWYFMGWDYSEIGEHKITHWQELTAP